MIRYEKDINNIVTLILDMTGMEQNVLTEDIGNSFIPVLKHLKAEKNNGALKGVIITSAKNDFMVGGGLEYFFNTSDSETIFKSSQMLTQFFRDLESPGVPVVAAMNGKTLGSGFGLALACHYRIAIDNSEIKLGLTETSLGLIPRGGEIVRLLWLLGIERAYHIVCDGLYYTPREALSAGIIDELATDQKDMMNKARAWLSEHREGRRPWDTLADNGQDFTPDLLLHILTPNKLPSASAQTYQEYLRTTEIIKHPIGFQRPLSVIRLLIAEQFKRTRHIFPAYRAVISTLAEASAVDFDTACRIQSRYFTQVCLTPEAKNMTKAFWYDLRAIRRGDNRPKGYGKFRPTKIGVIGAGLMGSGIAYTCAQVGLKVVLKDISRSVAEKGKSYSEDKIKILVGKQQLSPEEATVILARITATEKMEELHDCDIIIEAVFENQQLKSKVLKDAENYLGEYCLIASNTISIPITKLGKSAAHPDQFCGLRFFRPVDDEPLVEVIKGESTSDETIARAFDFIKLIKKIPIIVKDSWGFYAGRVRNTYILEGIAMLSEGFPAALIENIGLQTGMPSGPLAWADDWSLDLVQEYERQAAELYGPKYVRHPAAELLDKMIEKGRHGLDVRAGFYNYEKDGTRSLCTLDVGRPTSDSEKNSTSNSQVPTSNTSEIAERFLFVQALEALWCMQEKVVQSVPEANIGSIYGWGFPAIYGGVIQYVNDYGLKHFVERCKYFENIHGRRFKVPPILKRKIEAGEKSFQMI